jgi:hypothetical protein
MLEATDNERTSKNYVDNLLFDPLRYQKDKKNFDCSDILNLKEGHHENSNGELIKTDDLKKFDDASANNSYDTGTSTTPNTSDKETKNAEEKLDRAIEKGPDAGGVQVSAELYVVVGGGISISVGETRNGESYISLNVKVGVGIGGGVSGGAEASFATEGKKSENGMDYDPANMSGWNASAGGGYGATINGSTSLPLSKSSESKTQWSTVSSGVGVKASANISAGYNFVLFKW